MTKMMFYIFKQQHNKSTIRTQIKQPIGNGNTNTHPVSVIKFQHKTLTNDGRRLFIGWRTLSVFAIINTLKPVRNN